MDRAASAAAAAAAPSTPLPTLTFLNGKLVQDPPPVVGGGVEGVEGVQVEGAGGVEAVRVECYSELERTFLELASLGREVLLYICISKQVN
jgi:hypothetical protein